MSKEEVEKIKKQSRRPISNQAFAPQHHHVSLAADQSLPQLNDPKLKSKQNLSSTRSSLYGRIQVLNKEAMSSVTDSFEIGKFNPVYGSSTQQWIKEKLVSQQRNTLSSARSRQKLLLN